ncbi:MAG: DEAD/DEAH box helicase [Candidatus Binatia bacterium]
MLAAPFHPLVAGWFADSFAGPTAIQTEGWAHIAAGRDTLIAAPTGSGKTLAAFLWALNGLVERALAGTLEDRIHVVYISPLKALGNDVHKNLQVPLAGIAARAAAAGTPLPEIRVAVRTGDTPQRERALQARRPPHVLITTPESLYILLTAAGSREMLREAGTIILDEIHAVAQDKRGSHLALSVERFDRLCGGGLQRIGLSATQKPVQEVARLLVGSARLADDGSPRCAIVDAGHRRALSLRIETPDQELGPITSQEVRAEIYDRIAELVRAHRTTIVFVHTRRLVERVAHALGERLGPGAVAAHHGSMSRETRLAAEAGLKSGAVPVVVATASLELGIDVGTVDLVCHLGAPRALAQLLQRVGRSGHSLGAMPQGVLFPLTRDELVQSAAAVRAVRAGDLDALAIPENARDVLAQQIVAIAASEGELAIEALWALVRRAYPYRRLARTEFDAALDMLGEGVSTRRGRRGAQLHIDRVHGIVRPRRGARLIAITCGGAIPDMADYEVVEDATGARVGTVNEDFAIESLAGDVFQLGHHAWRIRRVESGRVRVVDATGSPPTIPFWLGESPARSSELSAAVADLRQEVAARAGEPATAVDWLMAETQVDRGGAEQILAYVRATVAVLGVVPTLDTVVAERFFDESGGMQLVLHTPFGGRINRALGLALRKRFCVTFDFELQAAATDDGVVISLGEPHSFPLESVFGMVRPHRLREDLIQAALVAPMFANRWRWNATRALALLRFTGGRRVPMPLQRMRAEDLLAAVFPAQLACGDNQTGPIEPPDHPLVNETLDNCLHEAMDIDGLHRVLERIEAGEIRAVAVETAAPSPMSHELLNANPYAFLDDAPLEERRARAVALRRTDPDLASGIGALDPAAIAEVRRQAWPDPRDADEMHDVLLTLGILPAGEVPDWERWLAQLVAERRATRLLLSEASAWRADEERSVRYVAAERAALVRVAVPGAVFDPEPPPIASARTAGDPLVALREIVQGWMDSIGPTSASALAERLGLEPAAVDGALAQLEGDGQVMRGRFMPGASDTEWCERGLLARIHRLTVSRLRREVEPIPPSDFMRFLFAWQHVQPGTLLSGRDGVRLVIAQLQGLELPGPAWERDVLPARVAHYEPAELEQLCLAGEVVWGRLSVPDPSGDEAPPVRRRQAPTRAAPLAFALRADLPDLLAPIDGVDALLRERTPAARRVFAHLRERGASFLADIARAVGRLPTEVEEALWELVASGLVTGDGIAGLRTLLRPEHERRPRKPSHLRALRGGAARRLMPVGRWALLREHLEPPIPSAVAAEHAARRLLLRWGVVFRELLVRERGLPAWRALLGALRRMEARGEIRGGRFVDGFRGEQFALPEAVDALRSVRRRKAPDELILIAAADPLNLAGIITPGARVSPFSGLVLAYRAGVPIDTGELGAVRSRLQRQLGA